jgi:hypothetical protein
MVGQTVRLRVRWTPEPPALGEFGMQEGRWGLVPGIRQPDGSTTWETAVTPYVDKAGRQRFRGSCVQGPPDEPFLYLSWRLPMQQKWRMRGKVMLGTLTPEHLRSVPDGAVLETEIHHLGHRDRGHVQEWRATT